VQQNRQEREDRRRRDGPPKDIGRMYTDFIGQGRTNTPIPASECWFCLSNPKLAYVHCPFHSLGLPSLRRRKHLLVSLGEECYITLTKGGLPDTTSSDPRMRELFPIPGGGHVLIVPISHHPTFLSLPADEAATTLAEVEKCVHLPVLLHW
jgi:Protein similar to CwfJ C-terminus 1